MWDKGSRTWLPTSEKDSGFSHLEQMPSLLTEWEPRRLGTEGRGSQGCSHSWHNAAMAPGWAIGHTWVPEEPGGKESHHFNPPLPLESVHIPVFPREGNQHTVALRPTRKSFTPPAMAWPSHRLATETSNFNLFVSGALRNLSCHPFLSLLPNF